MKNDIPWRYVFAYDRLKLALEDVPDGYSILVDKEDLDAMQFVSTSRPPKRTILDDIHEQIMDLEKRGARPTTILLSKRAWEEFKDALLHLDQWGTFDSIFDSIAGEPSPPAALRYLGCSVKPMPDVAVTADRGP